MNAISQQLVENVYDQVLHSANLVLRSCKLFSISVLKIEDPTYSEIAEQLKELCDILDKVNISGPDELKISNAREYANHVRLIAAAIETEDEKTLNRHVQELDRRPFL